MILRLIITIYLFIKSLSDIKNQIFIPFKHICYLSNVIMQDCYNLIIMDLLVIFFKDHIIILAVTIIILISFLILIIIPKFLLYYIKL